MDSVWWAVIAALILLGVVIVVALRGRLKVGGKLPGHEFSVEASRKSRSSQASAEDIRGRNVVTESAGDARVARVDASGDVTTKAGLRSGAKQDPKA
jgi:hypothetical protein